MPYTTTERVRSEAGLEGNTNVLDSLIETYLLQSHGVVQSYISAAYSVTDFSGVLFTGSQAEGMLQRAEELISAGYLLMKEFPIDGRGTNTDGKAKKDEGVALLASILAVKNPLRLLNINGIEFTRVAATQTGGLASTGISTDAPIFSTTDTF